jgi:hypothetical protein
MRYEDLVDHPEAEMREVSDFLGLEYEPRMETAHLDDPVSVNVARSFPHRHLRKSIDDSSVGRYSRSLTPDQISLIELVLSDEMRFFGYLPSTAYSTATVQAAIRRTLWSFLAMRAGLYNLFPTIRGEAKVLAGSIPGIRDLTLISSRIPSAAAWRARLAQTEWTIR